MNQLRSRGLGLGLALGVTLLAVGAGAPSAELEVVGDRIAPADEPIAAEDNTCRVIEVDMIPTDDLQIVVWIEDAAGNFVDTAFITRLTGTYGLGNRPGMMEFNSAWRWPYGRRTTTFPVWAHRHGMEWPLIVFQNGDETNLSHPLAQSSGEVFYCRPLREGEAMWDTQTCASTVYTDKGVMSDSETSLYPPRADLAMVSGIDDPTVGQFAGMNPFDTVSRATPTGDQAFRIAWPIPPGLPDGNYVAWLEVNKEFDQNAHYSYPSPTGIPWSDYGVAYRGQPSVLYRVPFSIGTEEVVAVTEEYAGYGDPDGLDGDIREPDPTITTDVPGSGAARLQLVADGERTYRVRVSARPTEDKAAPGAIAQLETQTVTHDSVTATFIAPGDDDDLGTVMGYEVRVMAGTEMTEANFSSGLRAAVNLAPLEPGSIQTLRVGELLPRTNYYIGVRAYDECRNFGPIAVLHVTTPDRPYGGVDACFVATAAYGSLMAADVAMLRQFRDVYLRSSVMGELFVQAYYTFGPAFAAVIRESELLREGARSGLEPVVERVRALLP